MATNPLLQSRNNVLRRCHSCGVGSARQACTIDRRVPPAGPIAQTETLRAKKRYGRLSSGPLLTVGAMLALRS